MNAMELGNIFREFSILSPKLEIAVKQNCLNWYAKGELGEMKICKPLNDTAEECAETFSTRLIKFFSKLLNYYQEASFYLTAGKPLVTVVRMENGIVFSAHILSYQSVNK